MDNTLSVSEFIAVINQTFDYAFPKVLVRGELSEYKVRNNQWVYFSLKDDTSVLKCFGSAYQMSGPLEDGMMLLVEGMPRLHNKFGFSFNVSSIQLEGEGTIRRSEQLLKAILEKEGLFSNERKRSLPYPPAHIGLITSIESAAYADFIKILDDRWQGIAIDLIDVRVQGKMASSQIVSAIAKFNTLSLPPEVLVIIRGGGSAEDLAAFSSEKVVRAIAASRIPTVVAIGHEIDHPLAELVADLQASTPSNAAERLVPDRKHVLLQLQDARANLINKCLGRIAGARNEMTLSRALLIGRASAKLQLAQNTLKLRKQMMQVLDPALVLGRGYAIIRDVNGALIRSKSDAHVGDKLNITVADGELSATVNEREEVKL